MSLNRISRAAKAKAKAAKRTSRVSGTFRSDAYAGSREGRVAAGRDAGIEAFDSKQPGASIGVRYETLLQAVSLVTAGLPTSAVARLQRTSGLTQERIQQVAGISKGSFARRKQTGRLSPEESERLLRVSRIFERATSLYDGDQAGAREWLETPIPALEDQRPLDLAQTEPGAREVEDLIGRIEHGVVS